MLITYSTDRNRFEAQTSFRESGTANPLLKSAGFAFDWDAKVWHTAGYRGNNKLEAQIQIAAKLGDYLDETARAHVSADTLKAASDAASARTQSVESSRATDADVVIPASAGLSYLPYQKAGIAYALKRQNTLIGDEMGLGKTIQAIGVSNATDARSILIVCPASLKLNWEREWKKWDVKNLSVGIASGKTVPDTEAVIVNYDILDKNADALRARVWDILIADECHKAKNPAAKRTQFLLGKYTWIPERRAWNIDIQPVTAKRRLFLTGTPIVNRPVELWSLIRALDPEGLGKYKSKFEQRYCGAHATRFGWDKSGATNLPELQERMRASFMVRRLKADVLKELPPKRRQVVVLEIDATDQRGLEEIVRREREAHDSLQSAGLRKGEQVDFTALSAVRVEVAKAKIPYVIREVTEALEEVDKLVVMAHHKVVIEALVKAFPGISVVVNADVSLEDRQQAVDAFQSDPGIKLFIGSIQAAGVGLTLTAASNIIFAELDWVPGNVSQAEDRCHRIGQVNPVLIKYLVLDKSVDARIADLLVSKSDIITAGLDTITEPLALPEVGIAEPPKPITVIDGVEVEIVITQAQAKAVHAALQLLAGRCDGAKESDGAGFNKLDSRMGKSLANTFSLTPKQALAGQKLVQRYQGQLPEALVVAAGITPKK